YRRWVKQRGKFKLRKNNLPMSIFLWVYALLSVYTLIWMIFYSFKNNDEIFVTNPFGPPSQFRYENYIAAWSQYNVPVYFMNSLIVAIATVIGAILLAVMFSYAVARLRRRFSKIAHTYILVGMFIPI